MSVARAGCYVDTCLLVSLYYNDSGLSAAEVWLTRVDHCIRRCILRL